MMGRFLNTIRHNEILREMPCDFKFAFKGDRLIQVKRTKKGQHGAAKGWPFNTGSNNSVCMSENSGL